MLGLLVTISQVLLVLVLAEFPADPCWVEDEACLSGHNLLSSLSEVPGVVTCRQLCQEKKGCNFFSHFGPESFPLREMCLLFSSCDKLHPCNDCRSEESSCYIPCSTVQLEGQIADNLVDIIPEVPNELNC